MSRRFANMDISDLKIDSAAVKARVNETLNAVPTERKIFMRYKTIKATAIAAAVTVAFASTGFAVSPAGKEAIGTILSYFSDERAREITNIAELSKYNEEIGASTAKDGYTLTLDNIAADDNFIHVFYTIKSDNAPFYTGEDEKNVFMGQSDVGEQMRVTCLVDGKFYGDDGDTYFEDEYTRKSVLKLDIAAGDVSDKFKVELVGELESEAFEEDSVSNRLLCGENISDEDKNSVWYISTETDKSKVKTATITRELNLKLPCVDSTAEKLIISPFGTQLVLNTANIDVPSDNMAICDENGNYADILNNVRRVYQDDSSPELTEMYELLKVTADTRKLEFIPVKYVEHGDANEIMCDVGNYPIIFENSKYGRVVVTGIQIKDGEIDVDYYKDGFVMYDPAFLFYDENGDTFEPGGKLGCTHYTDTHYAANSYTARYVYEKRDDNGNYIKPDESVSKETLSEKLVKIGTFEDSSFELDLDNAVTAVLKK